MKRFLVIQLAALLSAGAVLAATQASAQTRGKGHKSKKRKKLKLGERPGVPKSRSRATTENLRATTKNIITTAAPLRSPPRWRRGAGHYRQRRPPSL